ncbi:unnamed protein product, partial [marine sediment metagenome]
LSWIPLEDFYRSVSSPLHSGHHITLKRAGRHWEYVFPEYTTEEKEFFSLVVSKWLAEIGAVSLGTSQGKKCIRLTPFGEALFGNA